MRPLRFLHRDLPNLCAVSRREQVPRAVASTSFARCWKRAEPPHARQSTISIASVRACRAWHDLRREGGLCASDRYRARHIEDKLSPPARRADAAAPDRRTAPLSAAFRLALRSGAARGTIRGAFCRAAVTKSDRACRRRPCRRRNSRARESIRRDGTREKVRVALLPSCAQQALDRNINAATIRLSCKR